MDPNEDSISMFAWGWQLGLTHIISMDIDGFHRVHKYLASDVTV